MKADEITGKIMVLAIIVLFVVTVAVLFLHLYTRWFWWRVIEEEPLHYSSSQGRQLFVFVPGQDPAALPIRGLDPAVLRSIPVVVYGPEDFKEGLKCAVCLCDVAGDERARLLPKCNHGFHVECIDMWFQYHSTCPLCRNPVSLDYDRSNYVCGGESGHVESSSGRDEFSESESNSQATYLPVNLLIWGDEAWATSRNGALEGANLKELHCFSGEPSSSEGRSRPDMEGDLAIEIPRQMVDDMGLPLTSSYPQDELKSLVTGSLRSFRRILSGERRVNPCSPNGTAADDIELGGRNTIQPC